MTKRTFHVVIGVDIEITQKLLDSVLTDEWRKYFYHFTRPEDVAEHLAFNLVRGCSTIRTLDGFANQAIDAAVISRPEVTDVEEIKAPPPKRTRKVRR